jgi:predicted benzoate:H+ symporter BenE
MLYKRKTYLDILANSQEHLNLPMIIRLYRISGILLIIVGAIPLIDVIVLLIADNY